MKRILQFLCCGLLAISLTGCIAAAVGAGAAGGAYIEKHYDVSLKVKKKDKDKNATTDAAQH